MAAVEAALAAFAGVAAGFGLFLLLRPRLARVPVDGSGFYPSDLRLSAGWAVAVASSVVALAVAAAIMSLRRVRVSPLGVTRRGRTSRATARPLLLVAIGLVGLGLAVIWDRRSTAGETAIAVVIGLMFVCMIAGIVLSGPWLTTLVAGAVARAGRRAPSLLAARRLQDNPSTAFRAIAGIVIAVFVGTVFSGIAASILSREAVFDDGLATHVVAASAREEVAAAGGDERTPALPLARPIAAADLARLTGELRDLRGVRDVVAVHAVADDPALLDALARTPEGLDPTVTLASCDDTAALGFDACEGITRLSVGPYGVSAARTPVSLPGVRLDDLPVTALAVTTDGDEVTIERARTVLESGLPGARAITRADMEASSQEEMRTQERVSNLALAVTLVIAGCSLAVAVAGAMVERRHAFAQLRLAGTHLSDLRRVVVAEAAAPLLVAATASVALGMAVSALVLGAAGDDHPFVLPGTGYWLSLLGGVAAALAVVVATLPLLDRLTDLDAVRTE